MCVYICFTPVRENEDKSAELCRALLTVVLKISLWSHGPRYVAFHSHSGTPWMGIYMKLWNSVSLWWSWTTGDFLTAGNTRMYRFAQGLRACENGKCPLVVLWVCGWVPPIYRNNGYSWSPKTEWVYETIWNHMKLSIVMVVPQARWMVYPLVICYSSLLKMAHSQLIYLFQMVIFHSYVSLPEGKSH